MNRYALEMRARERHRDILRASPSRLPFTVTRSLLRTYLSRSLSRRDDCQLEALVIEWARLLRANDPVEWELRRVIAESESGHARPVDTLFSARRAPEHHASWVVTPRRDVSA
jgi:hypothetical protein